ncbi:hypothetical protein AB205_0105620 [Aquarana catesbeiana]|uniref:Uncharacterized protein n=1 Tax=Aquarana catesbeiana TaxID=8400 RepID=A0A2G9RB50_AQUCT|nr:hypothetical protein AB205_0105620 [Aquarana catesbeiana]
MFHIPISCLKYLCDVDVVEEETHFTSVSAHVLIGEIMVCNWDLQKIKEDINDVEKRLKNIIDVLGRIETTSTFIKFFLFF